MAKFDFIKDFNENEKKIELDKLRLQKEMVRIAEMKERQNQLIL